MSEKMYPIPFKSLMNWVVEEYAASGEIFGVRKAYHATGKSLPIFGERIETPFGPAAGPNSQLAQNIIAAYMAGARFFEVKTVQKMDGADLAACVPRPCILANDEGYNQEWSTELTVPQAMDEYIKAWCALKVLSKVYGFGDPDGFVFNMSVGYDLEGIKGEKVNTYIDGMMDANKTAIFGECKAVLKELFPAESDYIDAIDPRVSRSVTVSTLHGCPPDEIERIASYLISEKHLHTFVKCNPTILGYETARRTLDSMGYDYIVFDEHHFNEDLQWADAVPMFERLQALADSKGLEFGLKLSNTFPVDTTRGELPNDEMYMSGRSLFPLTIEMCHRISRQFKGRMRISFAGGAEYFNCDKLFAAGIWPITVATTILKPGGYNRLYQMVEKVEPMAYRPFSGTDTQAICEMSAASHTDVHHVKPIKPLPSRKSEKQVPWIDCFIAPCKGGCPIAQDIPEYMELCNKGLYGPALKLITEKNPLPFITGTICAHRCQTKCSRSFYDESVRIRDTKLLAAQKGYNALMASVKRPAKVEGKRVAIIGGGPTYRSRLLLRPRRYRDDHFRAGELSGRRAAPCDPRLPHRQRGHREGHRPDGAVRRGGEVRRARPLRGRAEEDGLYPHPAGRGRVEARQAGYRRRCGRRHPVDEGREGRQHWRGREYRSHRRRQHRHGRGAPCQAQRRQACDAGVPPYPQVYARRRA